MKAFIKNGVSKNSFHDFCCNSFTRNESRKIILSVVFDWEEGKLPQSKLSLGICDENRQTNAVPKYIHINAKVLRYLLS